MQTGELIHRQPYAGPDHPQLVRPVQHLCAEARSQRLQVSRGLADDLGHGSIISDHQRPSHPPLRKVLPLAATSSLRRGATPHALVSWKNASPYPGIAIPKDDMFPARTKVIMTIACGVGIALAS